MDLVKCSETVDYLQTIICKCDGKLLNEENTKSSLILPMLNMLGYKMIEDIEPEYNICSGRVDYFIGNINNTRKSIIVECKRLSQVLDSDENIKQLERYTRELEPTISILTNGKLYQIYRLNRRDLELIFTFNVLNYSLRDLRMFLGYSKYNIENLKKQGETEEKIQNIESIDSQIKNEIKYELLEELKFSMFTGKMYSGAEIISRIQTLLGEKDNSIKIDEPFSIESNITKLNIYDILDNLTIHDRLVWKSEAFEFNLYYDGSFAKIAKGSKISGRCTYLGNSLLESKIQGNINNYRITDDIGGILLIDAINILFGVRDGMIPNELDNIARKDMYKNQHDEKYVFQSINNIVILEKNMINILNSIKKGT